MNQDFAIAPTELEQAAAALTDLAREVRSALSQRPAPVDAGRSTDELTAGLDRLLADAGRATGSLDPLAAALRCAALTYDAVDAGASDRIAPREGLL